jgi:hypothetical protein
MGYVEQPCGRPDLPVFGKDSIGKMQRELPASEIDQLDVVIRTILGMQGCMFHPFFLPIRYQSNATNPISAKTSFGNLATWTAEREGRMPLSKQET